MIEVFNLTRSAEVKEIGFEFPQVKEEWAGIDYWGKESVISTPLVGKIEFSVIFPKLVLKKRANLTNMLSSNNTSRYLMVDESFFNLLQKMFIDDYQYFVEKVYTNEGAIPYYLIYLTTPRDDEFFDWKNCLFYDANDPTQRMFAVDSGKAYHEASNGKVLKPGRIVLQSGQPAFDLFRFWHYKRGGWFYISKRLKEAMEAAHITGVRLEPLVCYQAGEV